MKVRIRCNKCGYEQTCECETKEGVKALKRIKCLCGGKFKVLWINKED